MLIEEKLTKQELPTMTKKRIVDYIRRSIEAVAYMTIEELVKTTYTSHSAIIRLYKEMGLGRLKEFRFELRREAHQLIAQFSRTIDPNFPFSSEDSAWRIAKRMADSSIQSIKKAQLQIEHEGLNQIGKVLNKAQRTFFFAKGDPQITARKFQSKMVKLDKLLIMAGEYSDPSWNAANLTSEDYAIFTSYSGCIHHYERMMIYLRYVGAPTLLITGNQHLEMVKQADMRLVISQEEYDFAKVAIFSFQIAFGYVLNTLFSMIYSQNFKENIRNLKNRQELMQKGLLKEHRKT